MYSLTWFNVWGIEPYGPRCSLTHWGWVTHICVGNLTIIGSDNGLSPGRRQAIIWTNDGILLIGPLGTNFSEILIKIHTFSLKKIHLKMSSGTCRPFCLVLNVLKLIYRGLDECRLFKIKLNPSTEILLNSKNTMLASSTETNNASLCSHNAINLQCVSPDGTKRYIMNKASTYWSGSMVQRIGPYGRWNFLIFIEFVPRSIKSRTPFWMTSPQKWFGITDSQRNWVLQWRHNEHDDVSYHQPHDCLLNGLFKRRSKKTSKLCVTGLCEGNSRMTGEFPAQRTSNAEDVSIWWRHQEKNVSTFSVCTVPTDGFKPVVGPDT